MCIRTIHPSMPAQADDHQRGVQALRMLHDRVRRGADDHLYGPVDDLPRDLRERGSQLLHLLLMRREIAIWILDRARVDDTDHLYYCTVRLGEGEGDSRAGSRSGRSVHREEHRAPPQLELPGTQPQRNLRAGTRAVISGGRARDARRCLRRRLQRCGRGIDAHYASLRIVDGYWLDSINIALMRSVSYTHLRAH